MEIQVTIIGLKYLFWESLSFPSTIHWVYFDNLEKNKIHNVQDLILKPKFLGSFGNWRPRQPPLLPRPCYGPDNELLPEVSKLNCHLDKRIWTAIATFHEIFAENLETKNLNISVLVESEKEFKQQL